MSTWIARPSSKAGEVIATCTACGAVIHDGPLRSAVVTLDRKWENHACPKGDRRPHSRACGMYCPGHWIGCHPNCPTCHGEKGVP
ncbi:MAG: hypothetical protein Q4F65_12965 [Propionibacteriaceae bacterium]|nr:hypothetical protein [Propionibacteriaceae bacterium]